MRARIVHPETVSLHAIAKNRTELTEGEKIAETDIPYSRSLAPPLAPFLCRMMKCAGSRIRPFGSQGPIGDGAATDAYTVRSMEVEVCAYVSFFPLFSCVGPVGVAVAYRIILARLRWSPLRASIGPRAMHSPYIDPLVHDSSMY